MTFSDLANYDVFGSTSANADFPDLSDLVNTTFSQPQITTTSASADFPNLADFTQYDITILTSVSADFPDLADLAKYASDDMIT